MDEIAKQAHQGSVAAIVQIMNDRLADMGVRTRAVLEKGILQILCEAKESEQLEQSILTAQLQEILETIAPRNLRRANICSRIAKEQQLVWLEDIHRNPENEVLWSQEIVLRKPNIFHKWFPRQNNCHTGDRNSNENSNENRESMPRSASFSPSASIESSPSQPSRLRNLLGMLGLCTLSFLAGLAYNNWQEQNFDGSRWTELFPFLNPSVSSVSPAAPLVEPASPTRQATTPSTSSPQPEPPAQTATPTTVILPIPHRSNASPTPRDPFFEAVKLAEAIALKGQIARTEAEWLDLSVQWQKASELMKSVSQDDPRYSTARDRMVFYQKNSEVARARAKEQQQ